MNRHAAVQSELADQNQQSDADPYLRTAQSTSIPQLEAAARRLLLQDRPIEAVAMALRHGLDDLAAELLALGSGTLARNTGNFDAFFAVVQRLGPERIRRWPALEAAAIWVLSLTNQLRLAAIRLDELEVQIPRLIMEGRTFITENLRTPFDRTDPHTGMQCWVDMMRILIASLAGESAKALQLAHAWKRNFPRATEYDHATVNCVTGLAHFMNDRLPEAERSALAALAVFREERIEYGIAQSTTCAASAQILQGRVRQAGLLLEDASRRVSDRQASSSYVDVPLSTLRALVQLECGEPAAALPAAQENLERSASLPFPLLLHCSLCVVARSLLALNRPDEALAAFDRVIFHGNAEAQAWWDEKFSIERARTAAVAGETDKSAFEGPPQAGEVLELLMVSRRAPSPALLPALRSRLQQAEGRRDSEALSLGLFLKARIEHEMGQPLQARRSVQLLLASPITRNRVGSLAALAAGLRPMFNEALQSLLCNPAAVTPELRQLAVLLGEVQADDPRQLPPAALSKRERQIAAALLDGLSNREIAERFHVTESTVKWHLWNLFQKLGVRHRTGAARVLNKLRLVC